MKRVLLFPLCVFFLMAGCTTVFYGSPKIQGGRMQCEEICENWDMTLAGMVALGEYTDGCICQVKDASLSVNDVGQTVINSSSIGGGGADGVFMQMQRQQQQQQHVPAAHMR